MNRVIQFLIAALGAALIGWKIYSDWQEKKKEKIKRDEILEKAREAKAAKAVEREFSPEIQN